MIPIGVCIVLVAFRSDMLPAKPTNTIMIEADSTNSDANLHFDVSNEYSATLPAPGAGYPALRNISVVEPHKSTTLTAVVDSNAVDIHKCSWSISLSQKVSDDCVYAKHGSDATSHLEGKKVVFKFPKPYRYTVALQCTLHLYAHGNVKWVEEYSVDVQGLYVRRELRELTDSDRELFLDSFVVLMNVTTQIGRARFGMNYIGMEDLAGKHVNAAGGRNLDQLHDGMGFLTQHTALTQVAELSLQSVAPSVTIPYWDYTIESFVDIETHNEPSNIFKYDELWSSKWFGSTGDQHTITSGRFAHAEVATLGNQSEYLTSPYGYLRAPWNLNPSPKITRFHEFCGASPIATYEADEFVKTSLYWPTCEVHNRLTFSEEFDKWFEYGWKCSQMSHGPVHAWVGGVGGHCAWQFDEMTGMGISVQNVSELKILSFTFMKDLWRDEFINTPKICSRDSVENCTFICEKNKTGFIDEFYSEVLDGIVPGHLNDTEIMAIADIMFCEDRQFWPGDMLEASSPADISFWPIHPTNDRLYQYKQIMLPFKSTVWMNGTETFTCTSTSTGCKGHHPGDLTFWESVHEENGTYTSKYRTNEEMRLAMNPTHDYRLPYIYDHFTWEHCDEMGVTFPPVTSAMVTSF